MSLIPYSHSKISLFYQCPYKFKLSYIDKIKKVSNNIALYKGSYAHAILEHKFNYDIIFKTDEIFTEEEKQKVKEYVKKFENCKLGKKYKSIMLNKKHLPEFEINFFICKNGNQFFACNEKQKAIFLGFIDFMYFDEDKILNIIDWKTGKFKELKDQGTEQVELYAIWGFLQYPYQNKIKCKFVYIEHCKETYIEFERSQLQDLLKKHLNRIKKIEISNKEKEFRKSPSPLCNWCDYYKEECDGEQKFEIPIIKL